MYFNIEKEIDVQLNDSANKIEVSVLNHAGVESLKDNLDLTYAGKKEEPKTYFIGIGVLQIIKIRIGILSMLLRILIIWILFLNPEIQRM